MKGLVQTVDGLTYVLYKWVGVNTFGYVANSEVLLLLASVTLHSPLQHIFTSFNIIEISVQFPSNPPPSIVLWSRQTFLYNTK